MHHSIDYVQRLRTLPTETTAPYNWQEFQRRCAAASPKTNWRPLAAAAALLLFVCAIAVWGRFSGGGRHVVADSPAVEDAVQTWGRHAEPTEGPDAVAKRSRVIETWLASLPREPAVVRVGTRAAVAGLEDRIAQVDDMMTSVRIDGGGTDRLADLQRERFRLVGSLAQVRYAEVVDSQSP
jgi:hypothetical protein